MSYLATNLQPVRGQPIIPPSLIDTTRWELGRVAQPAGNRSITVFSTEANGLPAAEWLSRQPQVSSVPDASGVMRSLERIFTFVRPQEVRGYLSVNSSLIPLLLATLEQISRYFGQDAPVFLEVISDPESAGDKQLFVLAGTSLSSQEAFDALNRLDQEWWLGVSAQAHGHLVVDVTFL